MHLLYLSPVIWAITVAATCYYPDGSVAGTYNWVPCKSTTGASTCCIPSEGDVCMADGLCNWVGHYYFRGACTDQSWQDGSCAQVCTGGNLDSTWTQLQKCSSGDYCCGSGCCSDGTVQFALNSTATVAFTSTTSSTTSKTTTSTTKTTSTTSTTSTSASRTPVTVSDAPGVAASATSTAGPATGGGGGSGNKDLGVALGVGLGGSIIGVACAVAVVMLIRRDKRRKQQAAEAGYHARNAPATYPPTVASPAPTYQPYVVEKNPDPVH